MLRTMFGSWKPFSAALQINRIYRTYEMICNALTQWQKREIIRCGLFVTKLADGSSTIDAPFCNEGDQTIRFRKSFSFPIPSNLLLCVLVLRDPLLP